MEQKRRYRYIRRYIRRCIWGKKAASLSKKARLFLEHLESVALTTLWQNRVVLDFRCRRVMETEGRLFDFMLVWFLGRLFRSEEEREACKYVESSVVMRIAALEPLVACVDADQLQPAIHAIFSSPYFTKPSEHKSSRNPFVSFIEPLQKRYPWFQAFRKKLQFLEEDSELAPLRRSITLSDPPVEELALLANSLKNGDWIGKLMRPLPVLTHFENFQLALLHARLWLLRSELPVCYGCPVTYKDLRCISEGSLALLPGEKAMLMERINDDVPSIIETSLMVRTVCAHSQQLKVDEVVYHMKFQDYSDKCPWKMIGNPIVLLSSCPMQSQVMFQIESTLEYDEYDFKSMVERMKAHEPPRILRIIAENCCLKRTRVSL